MHKDNLPSKIDPFRFADQSLSLEGKLPLKGMTRLCPSLSSDEGEVAVNLQFGVDEEDIRCVKGHMETGLMLQCQRCLESFKYAIIGDFMLAMVRTEEEANKLPDRYDALLVPDQSLILSEMVEDELIVGLPIVAMHDIKDCKAKQVVESYSDEASLEKVSPFKVIEFLREKRSNK